MTHDLKVEKQYYRAIREGLKRFELRRNDRGYKVGDKIRFLVKEDFWGTCTVTKDSYRITYLLENVPEYGLKPGYCILGIKKERKSKGKELVK